MRKDEIVRLIREKKSFLCVGLDVDLDKIPQRFHKETDPIFSFNKYIIDETAAYAVAYKPNLAFYERYGLKGLESLQKTLAYMPKDVFTIADAKRGDIGNTSMYYARTFSKEDGGDFGCDAITVAPYMGEDSVRPFIRKGLWAIVLALTSNKGSDDFQELPLSNDKILFEQVVETASKWGSSEELMFVVGATNGEKIRRIRELAPQHFFLVPGVGAQGGSLEEVCEFGMNDDIGILVNSSRGIIYNENPASAARSLQNKMSAYL